MSKAMDRSYLLTQLKNFFTTIVEPKIPTNLVGLGQGYGLCSTAKTTIAKVVTLSNYELKKNGIVSVKFTNDVPASSTLNINSEGSKAIYHKGEAIKADIILSGDTATFMYDGSVYHLIGNDTVHFSKDVIAEIFNNVEFSIDESSGHLNITY